MQYSLPLQRRVHNYEERLPFGLLYQKLPIKMNFRKKKSKKIYFYVTNSRIECNSYRIFFFVKNNYRITLWRSLSEGFLEFLAFENLNTSAVSITLGWSIFSTVIIIPNLNDNIVKGIWQKKYIYIYNWGVWLTIWSNPSKMDMKVNNKKISLLCFYLPFISLFKLWPTRIAPLER